MFDQPTYRPFVCVCVCAGLPSSYFKNHSCHITAIIPRESLERMATLIVETNLFQVYFIRIPN